MARYYIKEEDSGGGCLVALIIGIIVICVLAWLAFYVLTIALGIILVISALIGTVLTLRNYIVALRNSIVSYGHVSKPYGWIIPNFVYKWIKISWETTKEAWSYNFGNIKNFFNKMGFYRFFSFKKWICMFSALSILIFGTLVSFALLGIQLYIVFIVVGILLTLTMIIVTIFALIGLGVSMAVATTNYISRVGESVNGSDLSTYATQYGYGEYLQVIKNYCEECITYIKDGFSMFGSLPMLSLKKWIRLGSSIVMVVVGSVMLVVFGVIHIFVLSILFVVFKIISLFHR